MPQRNILLSLCGRIATTADLVHLLIEIAFPEVSRVPFQLGNCSHEDDSSRKCLGLCLLVRLWQRCCRSILDAGFRDRRPDCAGRVEWYGQHDHVSARRKRDDHDPSGQVDTGNLVGGQRPDVP